MTSRASLLSFCIGLLVIPSLTFSLNIVSANSEIDALQQQITGHNDRLTQIEAEITQYEAALREVGAEKDTLNRAISQLSLERKKVLADLDYTETKIESTDLQIDQLIIEIDNTHDLIVGNEESLRDIIRNMSSQDEQSFIESFLAYDNIAEYWDSLETLETVRESLSEKVASLKNLKELLEKKKNTEEGKRSELVDLKDQYDDQQTILANNKAEKDELLDATKSEEAEYQSLLAQKKAAREQIIKELRDFEAKLQFILDPTSVPTPGTAVFAWPLKSVIITQYFGGTEFAKQNASVYAGRAYHPGIDMGVPRGTPIYAPLSGVVRATGNTDAFPGCYSWGKWTLIDHPNGLTTLYAHQDLHNVTPGQSVKTGDIIGYSGNTGYSTGPHLHFTVYATKGVTVRQFNEIKTVTSCGSATTPVAATEAYFDPIMYLPPVP